MARKKQSFTLIEAALAIALLGVLLTGLFNIFYQTLKKNAFASELKQKTLQVELFQQRIKHLITDHKKVWLDDHPAAKGKALFVITEKKIDPSQNMCCDLLNMLYLSENRQLCLVSWSAKGQDRLDILLDQIDGLNCALFDTQKGDWLKNFSKDCEHNPNMLSICLNWHKSEIPFVFFLASPKEAITYMEPS